MGTRTGSGEDGEGRWESRRIHGPRIHEFGITSITLFLRKIFFFRVQFKVIKVWIIMKKTNHQNNSTAGNKKDFRPDKDFQPLNAHLKKNRLAGLTNLIFFFHSFVSPGTSLPKMLGPGFLPFFFNLRPLSRVSRPHILVSQPTIPLPPRPRLV